MKDFINENRTGVAIVVLLVLIALIGGVMAAGPSQQVQTFAQVTSDADRQALEQIGSILVDRGIVLPTTTAGPTTTSRPSTTTTTRPSTTTTSRPTTTTQPPTTTQPSTTTTVPVTTTTVVNPPSGERFIVMLRDTDTGDFWWNATYLRQLTSGAAWLDGDRSGYRCLYAFLAHPDFVTGVNPEGIMGRVEFIRLGIEGLPGYALINDKYMDEGVRYFDGSAAPPDAPRELGQCPAAPEIAYEPSEGPWDLPTITYENGNGFAFETRDYKQTVTGPMITFKQTESTDDRVGVVAYANGLPVVVVYYSSVDPGVFMNSDLGLVGG